MSSCRAAWRGSWRVTRCARSSNSAGLKNGELLRRAASQRFEVFVTADQNLRFQQNLGGSSLAVMILVARSNALEDLLPLVPRLLAAISESRAGQVFQIGD